MATISKKAGASRSGLVTVFLVYILLVILLIYMTGRLLVDIPADSDFSNMIIVPVAFILPVALLAALAVNARKLYIDIRNGSPGARFKTHLILFFTLVVILSSVPQSLVSLRFVNTAIRTWFSPEIGAAINGGLDLSLAYYNEKINSLTDYGESPFFTSMLKDLERSPQRMWINIHNSNPAIDSIQIFDSEGGSVFFSGEDIAIIEELPPFDGISGLMPREDKEDTGLLRYLKDYSSGGNSYSVVISVLLPRNLDDTARSLTDAREVVLTYQKNQREFTILLYFFYAFFTIPLALLAILISFLLSDEVIRPIVSLEAATRRVSEGDYSYRILTRSGDELSNLAKSFNMMLGELENSRKKMMQTEKISAWQEIARQLAHELRNPLTPIKLSAERLMRKYKSDPDNIGPVLEKALPGIISEVGTLDTLLREFRDFSQLPTPKFTRVELALILNEAAAGYVNSYPNIEFDLSTISPHLEMTVDPDQLRQVFSNLIKNACEAIGGEAGKISIQTDLVIKGNSSYCRIRVQDSGPGIETDNYDQVFNPYFTTKDDGTGLGLPIVERIIFDHRGEIWFETDSGHGTTFFIDLPMERHLG